MRVAFIGNCQAQTLEQMALIYASGVDVEFMRPVWLMEAADGAEVLDKLSACDWIFSQRVTDDFPVEYARSSFLKSKFANVVTWPNIYFDGYFPGITYLYRGDGSRILGPLDEYHFSFMVRDFMLKKPPEEMARWLREDLIFDLFPKPMHDSLRNLTQRERELDISISDYVARRIGARRMFFAMNHPTNEVLFEMLRRLLAAAGQDVPSTDVSAYPYTLDKIILPIFPAIRRRFLVADDLDQVDFKGVKTTTGPSGLQVESDVSQTYTAEQLVEAYYQAYAQDEEHLPRPDGA